MGKINSHKNANSDQYKKDMYHLKILEAYHSIPYERKQVDYDDKVKDII